MFSQLDHSLYVYNECGKYGLHSHAKQTTVSGLGHPVIPFQLSILMLNDRSALFTVRRTDQFMNEREVNDFLDFTQLVIFGNELI